MICPYMNRKEIRVDQWENTPMEENPELCISGQTVKSITFEPMTCPKEGCGAWHEDSCRYHEKI